MRVRLAVWWVSLAAAIGGLVVFLLSDVVSAGRRTYTGADIVWEIGGLVSRKVIDLLFSIDVGQLAGVRPDPVVCIWVGCALALCALALLIGRPSRIGRGLMITCCVAVGIAAALAIWGVNWHPRLTAEPGFYFGWLAGVALLCATPLLRRRDQIAALDAWDRRPHAPTKELPAKLENLTPTLSRLARETRRVRVSLDPLQALDRDTERLVWDWRNLIEECAPSDAALLTELGLGTGPVDAIVSEDGPTGAMAVVELDAALAHVERTLVEYRSFGFR